MTDPGKPAAVPGPPIGGIGVVPGPSIGNIGQAPQETPEPAPPVKPAEYLDWAGVELAKLVLKMMASFVVLMLIFIVYSEYRSEQILDSTFAKFQAIPADSNAFRIATEHVTNFQKSSRDFLSDIFKTVLLNILLPVLTALLGYVFGKQSAYSALAKDGG